MEGERREREISELEEMLTKLNPMADEFFPHSSFNNRRSSFLLGGSYHPFHFITNTNTNNNFNKAATFFFNMQHQPHDNFINHGFCPTRKKTNFRQGKRKINNRTSQAQIDEVIRRTVCVSEIDHQVTEEQLAALFISCGQVVDCRICGDPNSVLKFAFIEFTDEEGARNALRLAGTMLGFYPVRVSFSKTAITPVNAAYLPRSEDEREMCARTIYCTNIDKKVAQSELKLFFDSICGEVHRLRLLGDYDHSTRIAFVEFVRAESAIAALNCSGAVVGSLPIRVSPSKTPIRPRASRPSMQ